MYFTIVSLCSLPWLYNFLEKKLNVFGTPSNDWIKKLKLPSWTPPAGVYTPFAVIFYVCLGYAAFLIWRCEGFSELEPTLLPYFLYVTQFSFNFVSSNPHFLRRNLLWSSTEISFMVVNVTHCMYEFYCICPLAGILMMPYLSWLLLSVAINYRVYVDNPNRRRETDEEEENEEEGRVLVEMDPIEPKTLKTE